jgi:hypothetical protein
MNQYYIYRFEHGLTAAEQRAADQRIGEMAAALADVRSSTTRSLRRGFASLKALGRTDRTRKEASVAAAAPVGH